MRRPTCTYETEDVLSALLTVDPGVGLAAVEMCGVQPRAIASRTASAPTGDTDRPKQGSSPSPSHEVEAVLSCAASEARSLGHGYLGTEHLVLGLIGVPGTTAQRSMAEAGLTVANLRRCVIELLGDERAK